MPSLTTFKLLKQEHNARRGEFKTVHGTVQTPAFQNVATAGAIKGGLSAQDLQRIGTQVMLCNTYHLHLRPGDQLVADMGGLHKFTRWNGPILTDSGGFQVFSLSKLRKITEDYDPDVIHCFGTEYPHTLAVCRVYPHPERILLGIQGICSLCAEAYFADLPERVTRKVTFRDLVKRDSLRSQQEKFVRRGVMEREAIGLAGNITGRTAWDREVTTGWNPGAQYYPMNETLRASFYEGSWDPEHCEPHSIFVSQGNYPLKGLHYLLKALPGIRRKFPDVQVYVAGNDLTAYHTLKQKLKISAYGQYLRDLIREGQLEDCVHFTGRLTEQQMRERFLRSHLFLCCSSLENSPNSLGEAMLLGVPCVSTEVGGIPSLFDGGRDGLWCEGHRLTETAETSRNTTDATENKNNTCNSKELKTIELENIVKSMEKSIIEMWSSPEKMLEYSKNAREHARKTHDKEKNFAKLQEIYAKIAERQG